MRLLTRSIGIGFLVGCCMFGPVGLVNGCGTLTQSQLNAPTAINLVEGVLSTADTLLAAEIAALPDDTTDETLSGYQEKLTLLKQAAMALQAVKQGRQELCTVLPEITYLVRHAVPSAEKLVSALEKGVSC